MSHCELPTGQSRRSSGRARVRSERGASAGFRLWPAVLLIGLAALWTIPIRSLAQGGAPLRLLERPSLLDDGDQDSLRAAVAQSLGWFDRQPPGRWLTFDARRVTTAEYATGLRRLLMLLAGDPPPEVFEERVLAEFDVLSSVGRDDGAVLVTGYHEPVIDASDRQSASIPCRFSECRRTSRSAGGTLAT